MRLHNIIAALLLTAIFAPLVSPGVPTITDIFDEEYEMFNPSETENSGKELQFERVVAPAGARASCPAVQNDMGTPGDSPNSSAGAKSLGQNPTVNGNGCVDDVNDDMDWYLVNLTAGKDIEAELVVPGSHDFDLYLYDDVNQVIIDSSEFNDPLEKVSTGGTTYSGVATGFYVIVSEWSGDGQYTLRVWTNNTPLRPDLTAHSIIAPARANASDIIDVDYTIENIGGENSTQADIAFILSTDETYSFGDILLNETDTVPALLVNQSSNQSTSLEIPGNTNDGAYYILVWPDAWGNQTEKNETNNYNASQSKMQIGIACEDLYANNQQNDANSSADAPTNWTDVSNSMGNNVTATYSGCLDGADGNDVFAFDVPVMHDIAVKLTHNGSEDFELSLLSSNGSLVDRDFGGGNDSEATSLNSDWDSLGGLYYVNLSHFSGVGNYTLDVWTNYTSAQANLFVDIVDEPVSSSPGQQMSVDVIVGNDGTADMTNNTLVSLWLSVDSNWDEYDHLIGNGTISSISMNTTQNLLVSGTVPSDIIEGNYSVIAFVDQAELESEKLEDDNWNTSDGQTLIGAIASSCATPQDDALTGADAGEDANNAIDIGTDSSVELIGCADRDNDRYDAYEIQMSPGLDLEVVLISAPSTDYDLRIIVSGQSVDSSTLWGTNNEEVTTEGSNFEGQGGTFLIQVDAWSGVGDYRLIVNGGNGFIEPPFDCIIYDLGGISDASDASSSPTVLGDNPTAFGEGCMDEDDTADAWSFSLTSYNNAEIHFTQEPATNFLLTLYDGSLNFIATWDNTTSGEMWNTVGSSHEGTNGNYVLMVSANGYEGHYNLTINTTSPTPADLVADSVTCPLNTTVIESGNTTVIAWAFSNLGGPISTSIEWVILMELADGSGSPTVMKSGSLTTSSVYGAEIDSGSDIVEIDDDMGSGDYVCTLMLDTTGLVAESNESNNNLSGGDFFIQNYEELWANDVDQDGFNTTDTGDGIEDDCPNTYGESTGDRYGCPDLDADGWSNANDFLPTDSSQWVDSDNDTFGDNPTGTDGDQCPNEPGVIDGDLGMGCPKAPIDSDGDGVPDVDDLCANTPFGTLVDSTGCEPVPLDSDGDGVIDANDDCADTPTGVSVDANGCKIEDNTGSTGGSNSGSNNDSGGGPSSSNEGAQGSTNMLENTYVLIGAGVAILVIVLLTFLLLGRRGRSEMKNDAFVNAAFATDAFGGAQAMPGGVLPYDATTSPQQIQYEQGLVAQGYSPDHARQYGDYHFKRG